MDNLSSSRKDEIIDALQEGALPRLLASHRYGLKLKGRSYYITLVDGQGATPEGEFVYHTLGLPIPEDLVFDQFTQPVRRGLNEYAKHRNGQEVRIRYLSPGGRNWKYTQAGRQWGLLKRAEVMVRIPVLILGENDATGQAYNRGESFLTVKYPRVKGLDSIVLNSRLTDAQKKQFIKEEVKSQLKLGDEPVLLDKFSGEEWWYDPEREHQWLMEYMITQPDAEGPKTSVALSQPMGVLHNTSIIPCAAGPPSLLRAAQ
jgi:hypothetical protein